MTTLFGIKNCDTVKKARTWLDQHNLDYQFHDVRSDGLTESKVKEWLENVDWQVLVNKRSSTWKQLSDGVKQSLNEANVIQVMLNNPTLIKRPVLEYNNAVFVGFKPAEYESIFPAPNESA
ncbi:MAG: ArsC family reductase [Gammaproteobacteria bacterium]|nr:MAG: ArsC family reductase [Gammaproteobacteria bacterium]RLA54663.1 MAG: ArsC family reductase [Gammaproteobacteria bacterium]